jgi:hypothetical protein
MPTGRLLRAAELEPQPPDLINWQSPLSVQIVLKKSALAARRVR